MGNITAALVRELREKTGAGMMDCKKALAEVAGEMEAAVDWLRKKGLSAASKKAGRVAADGLVGVFAEGARGAMVEVNSETDFVARNDKFQAFVNDTTRLAHECATDFEDFQNRPFNAERSVADEVKNQVAVIGENIVLRRMVCLSVEKGHVSSYVHNAIAPNLGSIGVLVAFESEASADVLDGLGKQIAMHIAATRPQSLDVDSLDPTVVEKEKDVFTEQARASGKPDAVIEKMIVGRMRKFFEEVVLLEQTFVMDGETKIKDVIARTAKDAGADIKLVAFERFALGEGIEKKEDNFAEEVASMAG